MDVFSKSELAIVRMLYISAMVQFPLWLVLLLAVVSVESVHPFSPALLYGRGASRDSLITLYFLEGYSYRMILCFLCVVHSFSLSLRQLKRILRRKGLKRRIQSGRSHVRFMKSVIEVCTMIFSHDHHRIYTTIIFILWIIYL